MLAPSVGIGVPCRCPRRPVERSASVARRPPRRSSVRMSAAKDPVERARTQQIQTTDLLAKLLQAPNLRATASKHAPDLNEEFFMMSSTYLEMARKEGNPEVLRKLETVLKVAMEEKQKTLRPEIQLLNALLAAEGPAQRKEVFAAPDTKERLLMNDRYFFTRLLDNMIKDVSRQPSSERQAELSKRLHQLQIEAKAIADS